MGSKTKQRMNKMQTLKKYVNCHFFELPEKHWDDVMVQEFIMVAIAEDTDVYEAIIDITHKDLYQHVAEDDIEGLETANILKEAVEIKKAMIHNAKYQIGEIIIDIENDLNDQENESDSEMRQEFDSTEARAINND